MKYDKIRQYVNSILFETSYLYRSTEDYRAGQFSDKKKELPVSPEDNVSLNSIVSRPPVEDDSYSPKTPSDLSAAVKALSDLMNNDEIAAAYVEIKDILKPGSVKESRLLEIDFEDLESLDMSDIPDDVKRDFEDRDMADSKPSSFKASKSSGEASLQDVIDSGILPDDVKSISGAKSYEGKAKRSLAMRSVFGSAEIEKAQRYALDIWVGALKADNRITDEQAKGFLQNAKGAMAAPGFKSFFELGFFSPAIKPLRNARDKEVRKQMSLIDVPPQLENMIFSQTVGLSPFNERKIRLKLNKEFPDMRLEEMDKEVQKMKNFVKGNMKKYQQDYFKSADLLDSVKKAWSKKSVDEKIDITYAAMDDAIDFEEKAKKSGLK